MPLTENNILFYWTAPEAVLFSLAWHEGFEPPTFWFVAKHSIRLS